MKRIGLFADVSNLYYTVRAKHGKKVSYKKLYEYMADLGRVTVARAYVPAIGKQADNFLSALRDAKWDVTVKVPKTYRNTDGSIRRKCDLDVNICMDVVSAVNQYDLLVLCTADGDLLPLVEWVKGNQKQVLVFGCGISNELAKASRFAEIPESLLE
jgi:uncharacterized LabA/DUF88 family protein